MSPPLRVGMLLDKTFPPDPRVANEARSLVRAGHEVHLLCLRHNQQSPAREMWQGIHLHRLMIPRWFYRKASAVSLELRAYRWFLRRPLGRFLREERIEVLHTHDLPMVAEGLRAARRAGIPLVSDLHENWPAALKTYGYVRSFPGRLVISSSRWERHEQRVLPHADRIIVVVDEAKERLVGLGIGAQKITVVQNTVAVDEFSGFGIDEALLSRFRDRFVLSYLGGFDRHRGLEMIIDAMPRLAEAIPESLLLLIGSGPTGPALQAQAKRLGVADRVVFEGYQPFERFPSYIAASSICLIPHLKSDHTDTTIPHKLFHYMLLGKPVVTSDCKPLRRIVEETGCGVVHRSGDAEAFAMAVAGLTDEALRTQMGEAGQRAVRERYHWDRDAERLLGLYEELPAATSSSSSASRRS